jgi:hypothetical protein
MNKLDKFANILFGIGMAALIMVFLVELVDLVARTIGQMNKDNWQEYIILISLVCIFVAGAIKLIISAPNQPDSLS